MKEFAEWLVSLREWSTGPECFTDSNIAFDILIQAYYLEHSGQNRSMKDIYRSVGHSESRVRSIVRGLENSGLLEIQVGPDGRRRKFVCTPKLNALMKDYHQRLKACP
jgi:DNA-binding MarR family transcriptional regulator